MTWRRLLLALLPVATALAVGVLLLLSVDAPPLEALRLIFDGALGSTGGLSSTLMAWVPLALAAAGLVVTFAAGLWNIGVEGQIVMGAVAATAVARYVDAPSGVVVPLLLLAGVLGGLLWGLLVGVLRVKGRVNEIFGGLGLDFVATGLVVYLVIGPWKRAGSASTSGTDLFPPEAWLPTTGSLTASWVALAVAAVVLVLVYFLMRGTYFGLRLRAVGANSRSAFLMGISTSRHLLGAFVICGALAGLGGSPARLRLPPQAGPVGVGGLRVPRHPGGAPRRLPRCLDRPHRPLLRRHLGGEHAAAAAAAARLGPGRRAAGGAGPVHPARRRVAAAAGLPEPARLGRGGVRWTRPWRR